ncbi:MULTISPECIES: glycosyltransferase [unclassified Bradyrhizobium]|uniref:glycosyltransferase n=1 Tax=unclassified Bradyrhizobium TaxID=2631580 RepID=UPI002FF1BF4A
MPEIFFVIGTFEVGGTESHLLSIARSLIRRGWKVSVYVFAGGGPLQQKFEESGATVLSPRRSSLASTSFVSRMLHLARSGYMLFSTLIRRRPAIAHFFLPMAYLSAAPIALLARVPIRIMSRRSLNFYQANLWWLSSVERLLHKSTTAVLGNSLSVVRQLKDEEGVPSRKLGLIYNGIDIERFCSGGSRQQTRAALGLTQATLTLIIVANLIPYKGHGDLIDALRQCQMQLPQPWHLLIVGRDDGIATGLKVKAAEAGIAGNISFLGSRQDVPELLKASDIGLLCSHEEGFSNAILEGMAAGLPMIVTDVGGNAEAVLDGLTGFVVPAHDSTRLAEAIAHLANDASLRADLGAAGRRRIEEHFSLDHCVNSYDELYRTLLAGKTLLEAPLVRVDA